MIRWVLVVLLTAPSPLLAADASVTADTIISGDEIGLKDGRVVRLDGIKAASPDAKAFLESTILGHTLTLHDASDDRYGRIAATVTLQEQSLSVEEMMLRAGLALVYPATGDADRLDALMKQEQSARTERRGLWATQTDTQATDAAVLEGKYGFVTGTVAKAVRVKTKLSLDFGTEGHTSFTIAIAPHNLRAFKKQGLDPLSWQGQKLRVRGWVTRDKNGIPTLTVSDPHQIELGSGGNP